MSQNAHIMTTPHKAREALHKTGVQYREARTSVQMDRVGKNRVSKYENRQYKPGDSVNFLKNMVNPHGRCGIIVEQMMKEQYRVRHGNSQYTKVNTVNMVPVNTADPEANPEDINITIEDKEEDTGGGLVVCPTLPPYEFPSTDHRDTYL